jgi:periplasmic protein TonB
MNNVRSTLILLLVVMILPLTVGLSFLQEDPYLPFAQVMPSPIGGMESIYKHIAYPDAAKKAGVSGKVYLLVYINEKGTVDQVKVVRGLGAGCDEAAVDGIKSVRFTAGKNNGAAVKVKLSLPIIFKID